MTKRIFRAISLAALTVLAAALALSLGAFHSRFTQVQAQQLGVQLTLAAQGIRREGPAYFEDLDLDPDCRITWIAADGHVLWDSLLDPESMENHLQRREVAQALETGSGQAIRYSASLLERSIYAARRLEDGTVLRLSTTQDSMFSLALSMWQFWVVILAAVGLLAYFMSLRLSKNIVRPINQLDLDNPLANSEYEEITPLLHRLDSQRGPAPGPEPGAETKAKGI